MQMLSFSERLKIEEMFFAWCDEHKAQKRPTALLAYMLINGWLNEEKIKQDLKGGNNE